MTAREFVLEHLPRYDIDRIIDDNSASMVDEEDVIDDVERNPERYEGLIRQYAPEWAKEIF